MALRLRVIPAVIALSASALLLSACVPTEPTPSASPTTTSPSSTASPTATAPTASASASSPTASAEPTATAAPAPKATPVDIACSALITPQEMYDFNPNYVLLNNFTPAAGSTAAAAVDMQGTACRWENGTSGTTIDVSVAQPASSSISSLKTNAGASTDSYAGYFSSAGGTGTAQVFTGPYWATISSPLFSRASNATALVADVTAALK
ncbi:arginyl-tRNA synthetase [Salinibacterium sp. NK8237]|uniref:arginyl-tRNA synthetase n=1 Tax=Salinibacterium sp. NK8237 TaxID=2792038 RepID=UPI0018CFC714|nr:arginyl-tRNA synthetase [Salinibacterium sp. NK8237]MBH0131441.1 arginyl-tRNA synthetase [Salinibacterium sp. NK8237]